MDFASQNLTAGQLNAMVKKLGGEDEVLRFLRGELEVVVKKHVIDCDKNPYVPEGWTVVEPINSGRSTWDPTSVDLYLSKKQKKGVIKGNDLRQELKGRPVLNANVLDYLLANPHLIPEEWKGKYIFFWGTIYRCSDGRLGVRCLLWSGSQWRWDCHWLDGGWYDYGPAVLASN